MVTLKRRLNLVSTGGRPSRGRHAAFFQPLINRSQIESWDISLRHAHSGAGAGSRSAEKVHPSRDIRRAPATILHREGRGGWERRMTSHEFVD
jgi:hypothetical protein